MKSKFYHRGNDITMARSADLPAYLLSIGYELKPDGSNSWRVPGNGGLIVWKTKEGFWRWTRFSTDENGDTISFLRKFEGMNTTEAINALVRHNHSIGGIESTPLSVGKIRSNRDVNTKIKAMKLPPDSWRERAQKMAREAKSKLWKNQNMEEWAWLHSRGLNDKTIKKANLGWIQKDSWMSREDWGLETQVDDRGNNKRLWLPMGLLIPITDPEKGVVGLSVRRFCETGPKYFNLPGSSLSPLILGEIGKPIAVCETLLDAWLIHQEAGDIATVVALGSSGTKPDTRLAT